MAKRETEIIIVDGIPFEVEKSREDRKIIDTEFGKVEVEANPNPKTKIIDTPFGKMEVDA